MNEPFESKKLRRLELMNEWLLSLILVLSLLLTDTAFSCTNGILKQVYWLQLSMSDIVLYVISALFLINMGLYLFKSL